MKNTYSPYFIQLSTQDSDWEIDAKIIMAGGVKFIIGHPGASEVARLETLAMQSDYLYEFNDLTGLVYLEPKNTINLAAQPLLQSPQRDLKCLLPLWASPARSVVCER